MAEAKRLVCEQPQLRRLSSTTRVAVVRSASSVISLIVSPSSTSHGCRQRDLPIGTSTGSLLV